MAAAGRKNLSNLVFTEKVNYENCFMIVTKLDRNSYWL